MTVAPYCCRFVVEMVQDDLVRAWSNPEHFTVFKLASNPPYYFTLETVKKIEPKILNPKRVIREMVYANIITKTNPAEIIRFFRGKEKELLQKIEGQKNKTKLYRINWNAISGRAFFLMPETLLLRRFTVGEHNPTAFTLLQHYTQNFCYVKKYPLPINNIKAILEEPQGSIDNQLLNFKLFLADIERKDFSKINLPQLSAELNAWKGIDACLG